MKQNKKKMQFIWHIFFNYIQENNWETPDNSCHVAFERERCMVRGFIKGWQPGKLTSCQLDHAWLLLLLNQVVFLQESVNINNFCPPVKTEYPPVQNLNETPAWFWCFFFLLDYTTLCKKLCAVIVWTQKKILCYQVLHKVCYFLKTK